jgi:hypothetical protein
MQPADDIKKLIDKAQITSSPGVDARILADALEDLGKRRQERAAPPRPAVWRVVMRNKMTTLGAAAAVAAAVLIALPFFRPFGSGVTFARAIQPLLHAHSVIFDIIIGGEKEGAPVIHNLVAGSRIRQTVSTVEGNVSITDLQSMRMLNLTEARKEAIYLDLKGVPQIPDYLDRVRNVLVELQNNPQITVEDLGLREIDGRETVGFFAKHPRAEITLWADTRTGLPVRIEQKEGQTLYLIKNMQFDVPLDDALFSMDVPAGYSQQQVPLNVFDATEADFLEGLRILAERFGDGQFPDSVALDDSIKLAGTIAKRFDELGLSQDERTAVSMSLAKYVLFVQFYRGEGTWYYRGKGVRLGAADKAIFWYRPKGSTTYRVIYGDLRVEDVARENLPEPLPADDVFDPGAGYQRWSQPDFVGSQGDFYVVQPDGRVQVKAYLTLLKGPNDTSLMPVRLPYPKAPLEAVLLGVPGQPDQDFTSLPFHKTADGTYNVELPLDKLSAGQTMLIFQWHMPLDEFGLEQGKRWVDLKSLIPVISYKLRVGVAPNSGFELILPPKDTWAEPYTSPPIDTPRTSFGRCGMPVQKRS